MGHFVSFLEKMRNWRTLMHVQLGNGGASVVCIGLSIDISSTIFAE